MTALTQSRQRHQDFPTRPVLNPAIPIMELSEGCLQVGHTAQKRFSGYAADAIRAALAKLTVESQPDPDDDLGWEGMRLLDDAEALQDCHRPPTWSLRDSADRDRLQQSQSERRAKSLAPGEETHASQPKEIEAPLTGPSRQIL